MDKRASIPVKPPVVDPLPSYWHIPKSPLANVIEPEPDQEHQKYDYTIIGSGISGTMIAYYLLKSHPSARIVMLEAREACGGATGRNGGHTKAASYRTYLQHKADLGEGEALKISRLEYSNIVETHQLIKDLGMECESQMCNTVDLIYHQETFEDGKNAIDALREDATANEREEGGMAWYRVYSAEEAMAKFHVAEKNENPVVTEDEPLAGAFEYIAGRVNSYRLATGILKICVQSGLQLCTNTPVSEVRPGSNTGPDAPKYEVITSHNAIDTETVIYATNGYTAHLLPSLQGAIVPFRGQITAQKPGKQTTLPSPLPTTYSFIYKSGYEYMIPRPLPDGGQHIVIGGGLFRQQDGGASEFGTVDDSTLVKSISKYLHGSLIGYFGEKNWGEGEGEGDSRVVQEWTGIMGDTADERPFVGQVPDMPGQFISAGFNGHGMVLCLKSAEALVKMIDGAKPEEINWFPQSFLITEKRLRGSIFMSELILTCQTQAVILSR